MDFGGFLVCYYVGHPQMNGSEKTCNLFDHKPQIDWTITSKQRKVHKPLYLRNNCSEDEFFTKKCLEYKSYLVNQGYLANLVDGQFSKVSIIPRKDLLKQKVRASKKIFPFVTTFNPNLTSKKFHHQETSASSGIKHEIKRVVPQKFYHSSLSQI